MKRTRLTRRTSLARGTKTLARVAFSARRTALRPISERRREINRERAQAQLAAWGPRPWTCTMHGVVGVPRCFGKVDGHELLSRSRAGRTDANLVDVAGQVPLCAVHNDWVESNPEMAHAMGLARHSWERG